MKATDWQELTQLTQGRPLVIERIRLTDKDIAIEGRFERDVVVPSGRPSRFQCVPR